jgi:hypothetical protein
VECTEDERTENYEGLSSGGTCLREGPCGPGHAATNPRAASGPAGAVRPGPLARAWRLALGPSAGRHQARGRERVAMLQGSRDLGEFACPVGFLVRRKYILNVHIIGSMINWQDRISSQLGRSLRSRGPVGPKSRVHAKARSSEEPTRE